MSLSKVFINSAGRLRSGWRIVIFVLAFFAIYFVLGSGVRIALAILFNALPHIRYADFFTDLVFRFLLIVAALGAGYLCVRALEGLPWRSLGLGLHPGWLRDLLVGSSIGVLSLAFAVLITVVFGGMSLIPPGREMLPLVVKTLVGSAVLFLVAALAEEAMFRGYLLQTLSRAHLAWLGVLLTSVPFGLVHLGNPNVVPIFTFANTVLAGVWLAVAYLRTRSLWLCWGIHWAWNWALGSLFGIAVSGIRIGSHPLLNSVDKGPAWLTGGSYGIEGGAACTVALLLSLLLVWRLPLINATPEMKQLTSEENPVKPKAVLSISPTSSPAETS